MTTTAPEMASAAGRGDLDGLRTRLSDGLRLTTVVILPCAAAWWRWPGRPWSRSSSEARSTPPTLRSWPRPSPAFSVGLVFFSSYLFGLRAFYSLQDTRTPFLLNCAENALNLVLAVPLYAWLGIPGLALAFSGAYAWRVAPHPDRAPPPHRRRRRTPAARHDRPRPRARAPRRSRRMGRRRGPRLVGPGRGDPDHRGGARRRRLGVPRRDRRPPAARAGRVAPARPHRARPAVGTDVAFRPLPESEPMGARRRRLRRPPEHAPEPARAPRGAGTLRPRTGPRSTAGSSPWACESSPTVRATCPTT